MDLEYRPYLAPFVVAIFQDLRSKVQYLAMNRGEDNINSRLHKFYKLKVLTSVWKTPGRVSCDFNGTCVEKGIPNFVDYWHFPTYKAPKPSQGSTHLVREEFDEIV
jgi:hypothetical protein